MDINQGNPPALSFERVLEMLGNSEKSYPSSSMIALDAAGQGPKWFFIGKRKFLLWQDLESWLQDQASKSCKYKRHER